MNRNKPLENSNLSITSDELKSKLDSRVPLLLFDIRDSKNFKKHHIPGSACAVCNEETKRTIMPRLPKDMEIVLVGEQTPDDSGENYTKQMAEMMRQIGLNSRYLEGGISSWKWQLNESVDKDISALNLKELLDSESERENIFLLDVREPDEFKQWNIEGSVNIPLGKLSEEESLNKIPKDKRIITICPHGNQSTIGKYILERYGYKASSLEGGLKSWSSTFENAANEYDINESVKMRLFQFRRIGKGCMSYLLYSANQSSAVVIDPVYPIEDYLKKSSEVAVKIAIIIDTHQHADHVSAAKELAIRTGATYYQSGYENYESRAKGDRQILDDSIIEIGKIKIKVKYTPGHTPGSISLLVSDEDDDFSVNNNKYSKLLFTGDTLFVNGIGRPDLRDNAKEFASNLYDTLHNKLFNLPEDVIVLPAHFDRDLQSDKIVSCTIKEVERKGREFLDLDKKGFIDKVSNQVILTPSNFKEIIAINAGIKPIPVVNDIYELEIGPNRCSISM